MIAEKYKEISNAEYHAMDALGSSGLRSVLENARQFKLGGFKKTDAMDIGSLFHALLLEPETVESDFIKMPQFDLRTKAGKADKEIFGMIAGGKISLNPDDYDMAVHLATKAKNCRLSFGSFDASLEEMLEVALCEKSFFAELDGVDCKCRPDVLLNLGDEESPYWIIIDLKSCEEPTLKDFEKSATTWGYHIQESFYNKVMEKNGIQIKRFFFLLSGKKEMSGAHFYEWGRDAQDLGDHMVYLGLTKLKACRESNQWLESDYDFETNTFKKISVGNVPQYLKTKWGL